MKKGQRISIVSGRHAGQTAVIEHRFGKSQWTVTLDVSFNTAIVNRADIAVPEYQWRGEYVAAMIEDGSVHEFAVYSQSVRAFSLALDVVGR